MIARESHDRMIRVVSRRCLGPAYDTEQEQIRIPIPLTKVVHTLLECNIAGNIRHDLLAR